MVKPLPRDKIVVASLDKSLADMGIDHVDVFNPHGIEPQEYDCALAAIAASARY